MDRTQIEHLFSTPRVGKYFEYANTRGLEPWGLYCDNLRRSASWWTQIAMIEVAVRNKVDQALAHKYADRFWFDNLAFSADLSKTVYVKFARDLDHGRREINDSADAVISSLSMGFWGALLHSNLESKLWSPAISKQFTVGTRRHELHRAFTELRQIRNRIAHHESLLQITNADFAKAVSIVSMALGPEFQQLLKECSRRGA